MGRKKEWGPLVGGRGNKKRDIKKYTLLYWVVVKVPTEAKPAMDWAAAVRLPTQYIQTDQGTQFIAASSWLQTLPVV